MNIWYDSYDLLLLHDALLVFTTLLNLHIDLLSSNTYKSITTTLSSESLWAYASIVR